MTLPNFACNSASVILGSYISIANAMIRLPSGETSCMPSVMPISCPLERSSVNCAASNNGLPSNLTSVNPILFSSALRASRTRFCFNTYSGVSFVLVA